MDSIEFAETVAIRKLYDNQLQEIVEKTDKIHPSLLFWGPVTNLLKELSMNLCATPTSTRYNSWVELGVKLGLEDLAVKSIENTRIMNQDPVYVMFLAYSQKDNSTIAKIYLALDEIERKDIICRTHSTLLEFHKTILQRFPIPKDGIIKTEIMPEVPHIFKKIEPSENKDINIEPKPKIKTNLYKKFVMLTYVPEKNGNLTKEIVTKIVKEFRKELNGKSIGVLMLEEHREEVLNNFNIIPVFYKTSHYIIPILTTDYLTHVANNIAPGSCIDNLDGNYATYIYQTMMQEYFNSGCKNKNVRCIIPDYDFENVRKHYFFQPLFQAWTKESEISNMAKDIFKGRI